MTALVSAGSSPATVKVICPTPSSEGVTIAELIGSLLQAASAAQAAAIAMIVFFIFRLMFNSWVVGCIVSIVSPVCPAYPDLHIGTDNEEEGGKCEGLTFVITGYVHLFKNRDEFNTYVERTGGKVTGSVTSKTNYLVNNDINSASSKNKKAKDLGIPIISEDEFVEQFGK